ncbi:MAG: DUF2817 domain-containing protein [Phycisphaerales bacterium]|nr:DUF2817 domain-containing protein [Phycisphaerales bacterium]
MTPPRIAIVLVVAVLPVLGGCGMFHHAAEEISMLVSDPPPRTVPVPRPIEGWDTIGSSVRGKPLLATTVGSGPRRVYVIGGIHGDEPEGLQVAKVLPDLLHRASMADMQGVTVRVLMDMNPDGSLAGTRTNTRGVDLNRNWPAGNHSASPRHGARPISEMETVSVHDDLSRFDPDLLIVFHSSQTGPFVNYDAAAAALAYRFASAARAEDPRWRVVRDMGYPTPGSLGSYVGVDLRTPVLTIEFQRGRENDTNARAALAGLLAVLKP